MITVRFSTGFSIQYNDAYHVTRRQEYSDLYRQPGEVGWIAQVPNDCIIEIVQPCRVYDAMHSPSETLDAVLQMLEREPEQLDRRKLAKIKSALRRFNALRKVWKR